MTLVVNLLVSKIKLQFVYVSKEAIVEKTKQDIYRED